MATPLVQLLRGMIDDPAVRAEFADGPMDYLGRHGYGSLDAADVREALLIMADGAPTAEAVQLHAGGEAIDAEAGDGLAGAAAGLGGALAAMTGDIDIDPADLDGLDDADAATDEDDPLEATADDAEPDTSDTDTETETESVTAVDDATVDDASGRAPLDELTDTSLDSETMVVEPSLDEPDIDDVSFASPPNALPADADGVDDWGDVL
jgi:hypothetical protein